MTAHTRTAFDVDLQELMRMVAEMAGLAERQLGQAFDALAQGNVPLAQVVISRDDDLDAFQRRIEEKSVHVIAQRQPLAIDLRETVSALQISHDLERIGDLAKNIGKRTVAISGQKLPKSVISGLDHMTRIVLEQVALAVDSYTARNIDEAIAVWNGDRDIDALNDALFHEAMSHMNEDPQNIAPCTQVLFCIKNLERVGDHATNIAETVHYIVTGAPLGRERPRADPLQDAPAAE